METVIYQNKKTGHWGIADVESDSLDSYLRNKRKAGFDARRSSKKEAEEKRDVFDSINKLVHNA